jgi:DNA-binding SARP family transcriptional activator
MRLDAHLSLVNGFDLTLDSARITLSAGHQRLVAYLGLQHGWVLRGRVAAEIWPDRTDSRATANLRSLLFRMPAVCHRVVDVQATAIRLVEDVRCDVHDFVAYARRLVDSRTAAVVDLRLDVVPLTHDLLPGWYDEWVLVERERLHQLRLHALDELCRRLSAAGRHGEAVEVGLAAVRAEPLRESGQSSLIGAYIAEGNRTQAAQQLAKYSALLLDEIGCGPSPELLGLIDQPAVAGSGR